MKARYQRLAIEHSQAQKTAYSKERARLQEMLRLQETRLRRFDETSGLHSHMVKSVSSDLELTDLHDMAKDIMSRPFT